MCSLRRGAGSLCGVRVGACPGVELEGWLRCFAHPSDGVVCRGHAQYPTFAPSSSELAVGFFCCCCFVSCVQNLPQLCMHAVIFSPLQFLSILLLKERCVQVQALQQRVPGPRLSHWDLSPCAIPLPSRNKHRSLIPSLVLK